MRYSKAGEGIMDFSGVLASVVIRLADVEWTGWVFDDFVGSRGLFLQGNHWGHVDLRKGYLPFGRMVVG